jgi:DNA polymerase (family 10)
MITDLPRWPIARARALAEKISGALSHLCDRIEVAGSIRRQRPDVGDIDLVCLAKVGCVEAILERCARSGALVKHGEQYCVFNLESGIQLDLWFAHRGGGDLFSPAPPNFGVLLLARTGSAGHNIWIAQEASRRGMHFNPHRGITRRGQVIASAEEADVFAALNLPFIPPERRER